MGKELLVSREDMDHKSQFQLVREPLDAWGVKVAEVQHEPRNRLFRSHKKAIRSLQAFRNRYLDVLVW